MRSLAVLVAALCALALTGCQVQVKSLESHEAAVTPNEGGPGKGDKYAFGGIAGATGGTKTMTSQPSTKPAAGSM